MGNQRGSIATTICQDFQALPRITARGENHLRELEWRISRLGAFVAAGQVERSIVVERLGVAIEIARLEGASMPTVVRDIDANASPDPNRAGHDGKVVDANASPIDAVAALAAGDEPEAETSGFTEKEIERAAAPPQGEQRPIESRHQRYYRENREKIREAQRLHYLAHLEARRERARTYYAKNSEREQKRLQKFYFAHRAHILEQKRAAYAARTAAAKAERR